MERQRVETTDLNWKRGRCNSETVRMSSVFKRRKTMTWKRSLYFNGWKRMARDKEARGKTRRNWVTVNTVKWNYTKEQRRRMKI